MLAIAALAASLFRLAIANYSLWFDEQASMFFAAQPLANLWSGWMIREPNPPLYYSLLKGWMTLFGTSERAARALSIAAGAGSIVTSAILTRQIFGRNAGILAAALTAISTQQLYYALQVRAYEFVYLAASCVLIALVTIERSLRRGQAWTGSLLVYASGCTACIYLHTTMFLLPVICTIALMLVRRGELARIPGLLLPLMMANVAIAIAAGWWLDISLRQMLAGAQNSTVFDTVTPWLVVRKAIGVMSFAKETGVARTAIALIFAAIAIRQMRDSWPMPETKLLLAVLGTSIGLFGLISLKVPIFLPRTIFWLSAVSTAFCAAGIAGISRPGWRWLAIFGLGALVAVNMATAVRHRQTEDWTGAVRRAQSVPGSRLIVQGEAMGLLLNAACDRVSRGRCTVPIIAVTSPDDRLDPWSFGLYSGRTVSIDDIAALPDGRYLVFRKQFYHDLLETLHAHGQARAIHGDPPLLGPVERSALID